MLIIFCYNLQKVLASRKELLEYDCREAPLESVSSGSLLLSSGVKGLQGECYGCASAAIEHCVTLLRALAMVPGTRKQLVEQVSLPVVTHSTVCSMVQGWRSDESTRFPPVWPGFDSQTRRLIWVEFVVGSRPCSKRFFPGYSGFPLS